MNSPRTTVCVLLLLFAIASGCTAPAGGTWPRKGVLSPRSANPPASVTPATDLQLQLATERETYLVGEPIYLMLRLNNTGARPRRLVGSLDPMDGAVEILVRPPHSRPAPFVPLAEADHDEGILMDLPPQTSLGVVVPVFFGANGWTFTSPGTYQLMAVYHSPSGPKERSEARSPWLSIEIQPSPEGAGEFLARRASDPSCFGSNHNLPHFLSRLPAPRSEIP